MIFFISDISCVSYNNLLTQCVSKHLFKYSPWNFIECSFGRIQWNLLWPTQQQDASSWRLAFKTSIIFNYISFSLLGNPEQLDESLSGLAETQSLPLPTDLKAATAEGATTTEGDQWPVL